MALPGPSGRRMDHGARCRMIARALNQRTAPGLACEAFLDLAVGNGPSASRRVINNEAVPGKSGRIQHVFNPATGQQSGAASRMPESSGSPAPRSAAKWSSKPGRFCWSCPGAAWKRISASRPSSFCCERNALADLSRRPCGGGGEAGPCGGVMQLASSTGGHRRIMASIPGQVLARRTGALKPGRRISAGPFREHEPGSAAGYSLLQQRKKR